MTRIMSWAALIFGLLYFFLPLAGMIEFSMKMRRGGYCFDGYGKGMGGAGF